MKKRYKILILLIIFSVGLAAIGLNWEPVKAATYRIITTLSNKSTRVHLTNNNGLVGYWSFDDCDTCAAAKDLSGNGNDGTTYSAAGPTAGDIHTPGKVANGINLDGSSHYVSIPNSSSLDITGDKISVSLWFKTTEANPGEYDRILVKEVASNVDPYIRYGFYREAATGKIGFTIANTGAGSGASALTTFAVSANVWYHLVGTYDGATLSIYANGNLNNSTSKSGNIGSSATAVTIGADIEGGGIEYTTATVDEVRIYNRALSAQEVKDQYNSTVRKFLVNMPQSNLLTGGLVGYWSFNGQDISGVTATDRGSGSNDGTLTNGPVATPGIVGQALHLDGANDLVNIPHNSNLNITTAISISAWIRHTASTFKAWEAIVTKGDSAYRLHLCGITDFCGGTPTTNAINFTLTGVSSGGGVTSTVVPTTNRWYHVVATYDGSAEKIYVDGVLDAQLSASGTITTNGFALDVGENAESTGRQWSGDVDEVRLYDRALSAAEVTQLYRAGRR